MLSCPSVPASRISTVPPYLYLPQATAINLLHGDHTAVFIPEGNPMDAILCSHEVGSPQITLVKGSECGSYSFHTNDVLGDNGRAEW